MIEALLFASEAPLSAADLARIEDDLDEDVVDALVAQLRQEYEAEGRAFGVFEIAGGYQILTRPEYSFVLERYETVPMSNRLSSAALETLAIVAFRQPVGRAEIEEIRGVGAGGVLKTLLERELVEIVGRGEGLGRPLLYGTTRQFLEHFGFRSLEELPRSDELDVILASRTSTAADEDESVDEEGDPVDNARVGPTSTWGSDAEGEETPSPAAEVDPESAPADES